MSEENVSDENATTHLLSDDESAEAKETATTFPSTNGKGNSKAHDLIMKGHIALVSFDVETGGEECGVCQISAVAFDLQGNSLCGDFDFYVKPLVQRSESSVDGFVGRSGNPLASSTSAYYRQLSGWTGSW
jgi:hypothetical protein